uniref:Dynein heavy chain AAA module D4 domain-containing protein n=1 Tax=Glossina brevipalpis TaxID=37001 RepID=A0A1A9WUJ6_9MUSC
MEYNIYPGMARMNLVFFKEAIENVTRVLRVISQPRGYMLNIGIGGSGRQVLVKLAAFILETAVFRIEVTKKYKTADFKEDLKNLYKVTGIKQRQTIFIFSGEQVVESPFREVINNMLSTGEIYLFKPDEFEELKTELERPAKKAGVQLITEAMYNFFMKNEALLEVAAKFLSEFKLDMLVPGKEIEKNRESLVETTEDILERDVAYIFSVIHSSVRKMLNIMFLEVKRRNYVTYLNYLQLVSGSKELLESKRFEVSSAANKLRNGLSKIAETQEKVTEMSEEMKISSEQVKALARS